MITRGTKMVKRSIEKPQQEKVMLLISKDEALNKLIERIEKGRELSNRSISTENDYNNLTSDIQRWNQYNIDLLIKLFNINLISTQYSYEMATVQMFNINHPTPISVKVTREIKTLQERNNKLLSIIDRLELFEETDSIAISLVNDEFKSNNKVFIVHGHDNGLKETVARLVENLGLEAIILHEKANGGKTIIEKLEANSDVSFAIVLLTSDDVGRAKSEDTLKDRARQNVIAELGYFMGKLGRDKVCPLYVRGVEIPTDFMGVSYVECDNGVGWKYTLGRELKEAGLTVNLNNIK